MKKELFFLINFFVVISLFAYPGEIIKQLKAPNRHCTGLTYDGKYLWVADRGTDSLYKIDTKDGHIIKSISAPGYWTTGLAWDGQHLWVIDERGGIPQGDEFFTGYLYMIDTMNGNVLHHTSLPFSNPQDLTYDGKYMWVISATDNKLIKFNPYDGTSIIEFTAPSRGCTGLSYDGSYLWIANHIRNEIYKVSPIDGSVIILTYSPNEYPRGMAFDGNYLWLVDSQTDSLYQMKIRDDDKLIKTKSRTAKLVFTQSAMNFGPGKVNTLDFYFAIPQSMDNQEILGEVQFSTKPTKILTDKWGQKIAHFHYDNVSAGTKVQIEMYVDAIMYDTRYFIYPEKVGTLNDIPEKLKKIYLVDDEKYDITHPTIQKAVQEAIGNELNVYKIVKNIYHYLHDKLYYERAGGWNTAPTVLERGNGSCSEYTFVFIAMCRAAGVPARYVGSVVERGEAASMDEVFHRWVEVYLPNYGWIPVDPSGGDEPLQADKARYFGFTGRRFLITTTGGGNSEYLDWSYNGNVRFTTEPKTFVVTESYGDWEPIY
ncbi:MAG: transglutaminase domain-containing protein [Bacteroidales bacterium]|jgi:transglutaminase-like putative cysteine protease/sugar lactone lactonase YvrE|nr:transglutaminase domain-containing protein [Bacteroidales bacterium]MDY0400861.1 transglutaminase domain-containing protein [Bacteroidales bacterium]HOB77831.1 transglutaminase domain-containing protein [Bacteroidales bacterium]HPZ61168.1 transglutaminase domain-containing protein [Bacteroidales bacterium]HQD58861.1 transglutaminase domain-containing protein [Bacteroidales bacterium]